MPQTSNGRRQIVVVEAPAHPVAQLQGPFEESMFESQSAAAEDNDVPLDATTRRNMLLEAPTYQRVIAGRWKQKPGEKFHPLWKLVAQMSFGIHLLSEGMARSEEDVFQILQNHVDDIDIFLERTTEDFTLAHDDIQERLKCLQLPLQHPDVFERMLEDRGFRTSIVEGNEKIEHIVSRTGSAMKDALKDVQKGFDSTSALEKYLAGLESTWVRQSQEHEAVYVAMVGNVEGWKKAFLDLHMQGNKLAGSLRKLTEVVNQMQQKAGEVSRRLVRQQHKQGGSIANSNSFTYHSRQQSPNRSTSRQQQTQPSNKRIPERQHSRTASREAPRIDSGQAQRSGTGLSMRSGDVRVETPSSRSVSRAETPAGIGGQDSARMNIGSPRVVYVKNHAAPHRANSVTASVKGPPANVMDTRNDSALSNRSVTPQHQLKKQESSVSILDNPTPRVIEPKQFAPVELPAEIPPGAFLQAPLSNRNNRLSGLGFLPSERRAQAATASSAFNPATALVELLRDPSRYSKLPLTPTSATTPTVPSAALSVLEGTKGLKADARVIPRELTPEKTPSVGDDDKSDGTPATPAWASQVLNDIQQVLTEKIPSSTQTPKLAAQEDTSATPKVQATKPAQPKLDTSVEASSSQQAGSADTSSGAPSELSAGYEENLPRLTRQQAEAAMMINTPETTTKLRKKLSFIAELPGSEPVFLPSTVYTPISAVTKTSETHELQGSDSYFTLPIQLNNDDPISAAISELSSDRSSRLIRLDEKTLQNATSDQIQFVLEEVIKKSVSDLDPNTTEEFPTKPARSKSPEISELPTQMTPKPQHTQRVPTPEVDTLPETKNIVTASSPVIDETKTTSVAETKLVEEGIKSQSSTEALLKSDVVIPESSQPAQSAETALQTADEAEKSKSRPVTTIRSPAEQDQTKTQSLLPSSSVAAVDNSIVSATSHTKPDSETPRAPTFQRSVSETKVTLGTKRLSLFPALRSPTAPTMDNNTDPASPASAPDVATKSSPKSSMSATSPASLMSVHSAPAADLNRSTTKETRKQWKAFFSGQLKSPKSPAASVVSLKSPSASIASSHKHTNSQASQTNASVKTLWLSSPVIAHSPAKEAAAVAEGKDEVADTKTLASVDEKKEDEKRPELANIHQASSPTLGATQSGIGLGLITSPTVQSPASAIDSPVVAMATTSTAYARPVMTSISSSSARSTPPATASTFISYPKPRMIEVRRKAVGSGIGSASNSRPSSAAEKQRRDEVEEDKTRLSVKPESRSASPLQNVTNTPEIRTDDEATPRIGPVTDVKPKLTVEINTPKQIQVVQISKASSPAIERAKTMDSPAISPKTKIGEQQTDLSVQKAEIDNMPAVQITQVDSIAETSTSHSRQTSESSFTKGHERDSSDDNYDFLDAYA